MAVPHLGCTLGCKATSPISSWTNVLGQSPPGRPCTAANCIQNATHGRWSPPGPGEGASVPQLVARARDGAKAAGCEYLHVDFEDHLGPFYFGACGFAATNAGLLSLE